MQIIGLIFNTIFFGPIVNALVFLIRLLESIHFPGALGFSIIFLSILIRILVWPFIGTQLKSAKKMAELKPHLDELKKKHGSDKQAFAKAQMDLYKEHGVNPAGGCLPTLIQLPVLIALYQSIFAFFSGSAGLQRINNLLYFPAWHLDKAPQASFLGFNLAHKPSEFASAGIFLLAIPAVTAALTFAQSKMMSPTPVKTYQSDSPKEKKEKAQSEDTMVAVQSQMTYLMPLMIGYFAFQFPIGLALYWNTITILGIIQQYTLSGWGGLNGLVSKLPLIPKPTLEKK